MRKENLFRNKATKSLVAALAVAMAATIVPVSADAAKTTKVTIAKGDTKKLSSKLKKAASKNKKVVTVTKTGKATAKKAGTTTVTATKNGKKVTYKVTVKKAPTLSKKSVSVKAGSSKTVKVNKNGANYLKVSFKSADKNVATVNKNGKITGVAEGATTVTATVKGYTKSYKLKVKVNVTAAEPETPEPETPDTPEPETPDTNVLPDATVKEASVLTQGTYNNVTITSDVTTGTVYLGKAKIGKLYLQSGAEYNVDASEAEIGEIEVVGAGVTAKAERLAKAPRLNFGNNAKAASIKVTIKANIYIAGTAKLGSIVVTSAAEVYVATPAENVSIEGNAAKVSLNGTVGTVVIKAENVAVALQAGANKVSVEAKKATIAIPDKAVVAEIVVTEAAEETVIAGNGKVETVAINAEKVEVKTAVTKATVSEKVTSATIGGTKVEGGKEAANVAAVAGQKDTDVVTTVTDSQTNTGGSTSGGGSISGGGSTGGGNSSDIRRTSTATVKMTPETTYLTAKIGTQTIEITKENIQTYFEDTTKQLLYKLNGVEKTYSPSYTSSTLDSYAVTIDVDGYRYHITVSRGKELDMNTGTVTVTAEVPFNVTGELVLLGDKIVVESEKVTVNNKENTGATLTVGTQSLTVTMADARKLANKESVTIDGVVLKAADSVDKDTIKGLTTAADIATGNATLKDGTKVTLHVVGYKSEDLADGTKKHTVTVYATASASPNTNVSITVQ